MDLCPTCKVREVVRNRVQCRECGAAFTARVRKGRAARRRAELRAEWRENAPEYVRARDVKYRQRRRARIKGLPVEKYDLSDVWERTSGLCGICGEAIKGAWEVDHIVPISWPECPGDILSNVQPAHALCNRSKGGRTCISILTGHAPAYADARSGAMPTRPEPDLT